MILDKNRLWDGFESAISGQDSGKNPALIGKDQFAELENVICRGGWVKSRPGFRKLTQSYTNAGFSYDVAGFSPGTGTEIGELASQWFSQNGMFQTAMYYTPPGSEACIMVSIGGRLYRCVPRVNNTMEISEVPIPDKRNRVDIPLAYMTQADRFLVLQDGESTPIIYDGTFARRANSDEVPVGNQMTYGMGRLVVVRLSSREIIFGDLYGSHPTDPTTGSPVPGIIGDPGASVLKFTETLYLSEGGTATIPVGLGNIVAPIFYPQQDTASGNGELLVFAEKGMASFFLSQPREQWKESAFQRLGLLEIGGTGHRAFTAVNGDIWFRSEDGWRSYRQARAEIHGWSQLPQSTEVNNYLASDTSRLLQFGSSIHFDNRLLMTCNPVPNVRYDTSGAGGSRRWPAAYNQGILSLDFDVLSSFGQATRPAWDGHWNNLKSYQLVVGFFSGEERAFAFGPRVVGSSQSDIGTDIFEISMDDVRDHNGAITSSVTSRSMTFEQPFNEKELYGADNWHDQIRTNTDVTVKYRPDQYPEWLTWENYSLTPHNATNLIDAGQNPTNIEGFSPRRSLSKPAKTFDSVATKRETTRGFEFQIKTSWTGNCALRKHRLISQVLPERATAKHV